VTRCSEKPLLARATASSACCTSASPARRSGLPVQATRRARSSGHHKPASIALLLTASIDAYDCPPYCVRLGCHARCRTCPHLRTQDRLAAR
jgi:hypothetical protein